MFSNGSDEPHYLKHYVKKPIYQEVHEIITPYRKITQKIEPVHEEIETLVAKKSHHHHDYHHEHEEEKHDDHYEEKKHEDHYGYHGGSGGGGGGGR